MVILDLFCCAGGAAMGYSKAGFEVVGVDICDQPHYPFPFIKMDAFEFLKNADLTKFDAIHASPPCQRYTRLKSQSGMSEEEWDVLHPDLIPSIREALIRSRKPYIIENVVGSPLKEPIRLRGDQFGLYTQRERLFESNVPLHEPGRKSHRHGTKHPNQGISEDGFISIAGNGHVSGLNQTQVKLYWGFALGGIDWMDIKELSQAIPPVYTEYIGRQLMSYILYN